MVVRLSLQMISIQSAVLFAFEYAETVESANVDSSINHDDLKDSLQAFTSAIEAKIAEQSAAGKKGGKDKNAPSVPAEVKIDVSQLNDALCYSLPDDAIKTALSVQIAFDRKCKRKGFVLDIWERDLYADIDDLCNLRDRFSLQKMTVPSEYPFFTYILEIQVKLLSYT